MTHVTPEAFPAKHWAAEQRVKTLLCKFIPDVDEISEGSFVLLADRISQFQHHPVTNRHMAELKQAGLRQIGNRTALNQAADILREEMEKWRGHPQFGEHVRRWQEAIVVLEMPRGPFDSPHDWLHAAPRGSAIRGWTYMAVELAGYVIQILRAYKIKASIQRAGGVTKFVREVLIRCGVTRSLPTISKALRANLPAPPPTRTKGPYSPLK
jgi:hypothetical protein